jgi:nucleoside-diphosphate kinase
MPLETTLILFKPDAVAKNLVGTVLARFQDAGFIVRGIKMMHLSDEILAEHYSHIADKPFFPAVRGFMQETPVIALALEGENVISAVRDLLGPTDSIAAAPGTIRGDFGFKDADAKMRNVCHASDSTEAAQAELKRFFKDGETFAYGPSCLSSASNTSSGQQTSHEPPPSTRPSSARKSPRPTPS